MSLSLVPTRVFSSYAAVTPEYLADRGVRLLLSDLDFTLAPKSCPAPDEAVRAWIASMQRAGIEVMILSNNRSPVRVERFCKDLGIRYIGWAKKPWPPGFRRARALTGVPAGETAMLGDKLLTDMLGANPEWLPRAHGRTDGRRGHAVAEGAACAPVPFQGSRVGEITPRRHIFFAKPLAKRNYIM